LSDKNNWNPQRLVARRDGPKGEEFLVKWDSEGAGLTYDQCTWESGVEGLLAEEQHAELRTSLLDREAAARERATPLRMQQAARLRTGPLQRLTEQPAWLAPQREGAEGPRPQLMPHQLEAVNWLRKCYHTNQNVILADEMGLGKTVTALSYIRAVEAEFLSGRPSIAVVPLSTLANWASEARLWVPTSNVVIMHGNRVRGCTVPAPAELIDLSLQAR
jgi:chromodomain-helicase-DNA-binding protein 4